MSWLVLLLGVFAIAVVMVLFGDRCPRCRRVMALRKTGVIKEDERAKLRSTVGESRCRYCGYTAWRPEPEPDGTHGGGRGTSD